MKQIPERLSLRLGDLRKPLERKLNKTKQTPSAYLQALVAADLGVAKPVMRPGPVTGLSKRKVSYKTNSRL
jgi:hypothetical protein